MEFPRQEHWSGLPFFALNHTSLNTPGICQGHWHCHREIAAALRPARGLTGFLPYLWSACVPTLGHHRMRVQPHLHHPDYSLRSREVQASFSQLFKVQASASIHTVLLRLWPDAPSQDKAIPARTGPPQGEWQCCLGRAVPRRGSPWASFDSCQLQGMLSTQNCCQIPHLGAGPVSPTPFPGAP